MIRLDHLSPSECLIYSVYEDSQGYGIDNAIRVTAHRCGITVERVGEVLGKIDKAYM